MKKTVNAEAMGGVYIDLRLIVSNVSTHGIPYEQNSWKFPLISLKYHLSQLNSFLDNPKSFCGRPDSSPGLLWFAVSGIELRRYSLSYSISIYITDNDKRNSYRTLDQGQQFWNHLFELPTFYFVVAVVKKQFWIVLKIFWESLP